MCLPLWHMPVLLPVWSEGFTSQTWPNQLQNRGRTIVKDGPSKGLPCQNNSFSEWQGHCHHSLFPLKLPETLHTIRTQSYWTCCPLCSNIFPSRCGWGFPKVARQNVLKFLFMSGWWFIILLADAMMASISVDWPQIYNRECLWQVSTLPYTQFPPLPWPGGRLIYLFLFCSVFSRKLHVGPFAAPVLNLDTSHLEPVGPLCPHFPGPAFLLHMLPLGTAVLILFPPSSYLAGFSKSYTQVTLCK